MAGDLTMLSIANLGMPSGKFLKSTTTATVIVNGVINYIRKYI